MTPNSQPEPVAAAGGLSLRVSVATLVRVVFDHPHTGERLLALEHRATVLEQINQQQVNAVAQPFGGAMQFRDLAPLHNLIGHFQFDSAESQAENDFRILIRPEMWEAVKEFCLNQFEAGAGAAIDSDPTRELVEEFNDALGLDLRPEQYQSQAVGIVIEDRPTPTDNQRAAGRKTVRLYRIFETRLLDEALITLMLANGERYSDQALYERALADLRQGGRGRANAVLVVSLPQLTQAYLALSPEARAATAMFNGHRLDRSVAAVLERVDAPGYQRL